MDSIELSREAILNFDDLPVERVEVPQWNGGHVFVRTMTGAERDKFEQSCVNVKMKGRKTEMTQTLDNYRARFLALVIVSSDKKRLFTDGDIKLLGEKSSAALDTVFTVAQRLNKMTDDDFDDLVKNSESGQEEDSITD